MREKCSYKLLLVEDEAIIAMARARELEKMGYSIIHAVSGHEAIKYAQDDNGLDMILMDIDLGDGINGIETATMILKKREVPILFVSNNREPQVINTALSVSPCGYLNKSASIEKLSSKISSVLDINSKY